MERNVAVAHAGPSRLVGKLDWVTKHWLLETFMHEERIGWDDPWLASLDLEYHNMNPERGLFLGLEAEGKAWRMTTEQDIRAGLGWPAHRYARRVARPLRQTVSRSDQSMQWERIQFSGGLLPRTLEMGDLFEPADVQACAAVY